MYALSLILLLCLSAQTINGENRNDGQAIGFKNNTLHGYAMNCEIIALSNTDVAQKIAKRFDKELIVPAFRQFADGEVNVKLDNYERYEDKTVVIVQSTGRRVNEYTLGVAFLAQEKIAETFAAGYPKPKTDHGFVQKNALRFNWQTEVTDLHLTPFD